MSPTTLLKAGKPLPHIGAAGGATNIISQDACTRTWVNILD